MCIYPSEPSEYCIGDTFNPQCSKGEVVAVTSAKYGRMKVGKCVPADLGKLYKSV